MNIFNDSNIDFGNNNFKQKQKLTISLQQRNNRQWTTIITGWEEDLDIDKILRYLKKTFNCNGSILHDEEYGEVMKLTGNQKDNVYNFILEEKIYDKDDIIVKGF